MDDIASGLMPAMNAITLGCAVVYGVASLVVKRARCKAWGSPIWMARQLFTGATLVPFFLLTLAVFDTALVQSVIESQAVISSLAGLLGILWLVGELIENTRQVSEGDFCISTPQKATTEEPIESKSVSNA